MGIHLGSHEWDVFISSGDRAIGKIYRGGLTVKAWMRQYVSRGVGLSLDVVIQTGPEVGLRSLDGDSTSDEVRRSA